MEGYISHVRIDQCQQYVLPLVKRWQINFWDQKIVLRWGRSHLSCSPNVENQKWNSYLPAYLGLWCYFMSLHVKAVLTFDVRIGHYSSCKLYGWKAGSFWIHILFKSSVLIIRDIIVVVVECRLRRRRPTIIMAPIAFIQFSLWWTKLRIIILLYRGARLIVPRFWTSKIERIRGLNY